MKCSKTLKSQNVTLTHKNAQLHASGMGPRAQQLGESLLESPQPEAHFIN